MVRKKISGRLLFIVCMVVIMTAMSVQSTVLAAKTKAKDNTCGKTAEWTYDEGKKALTITGSGRIERADDWNELEITKIVVKDGIIGINAWTFSGMAKVTSVSLPSTLTKIDDYAFYGCKKMNKINLPQSLEELGSNVFQDCRKLKSIQIPDSVTKIGYNLFINCKALEDVKLSHAMTEIPQGMFNGCKGLVEYEIPQYITRICSFAFSNSGLEKIVVPKTVKDIEGYAFTNSSSLEFVHWNLDKIPYGTFEGCESLKQMKCGVPVIEIGDSAFERTGFETFQVPESVKKIGSRTFARCENLKKLTIGKGVAVVPSSIVYGSINLEKVVLEKGVKKIDAYAFNDADIKSIVIPDTVTAIGVRAFRSCQKLESVVIPNSVKQIPDYAFAYCNELKTVKIGSGVKLIGEGAFRQCLKLESVSIPGNVKKIGYKAFTESGIKSLSVKDGVEELDYWAFFRCPNLERVEIGKSVKSIRYSAFIQCEKLQSIQVSPANRYYASRDGVLYSKDMKKLISCPVTKKGVFTIPAQVSTIYGSSFSKCNQITAFKVEAGNPFFTEVDGIVYSKDRTVLVACPPGKAGRIKVPAGVKSIGDYAFHYSKASAITLPSGLQSIGYSAFEYCEKLKEIVIPGTVRVMGSSAFWRCEKLEVVEIKNGITKLPDDAFNGCYRLEKITVPVSVTSISSTTFQNCGSMVFYTKKSSYAMKFATKNYYRYKLI